MSKDIEVEDLTDEVIADKDESKTDSKDKSHSKSPKTKKEIKQEKKAAKKALKKDPAYRKKRRKVHLIRCACAAVIITGLYCLAVFSSIPVIAKWRTMYIETAMSTMTHQWLATYFIPNYIIIDILDEKNAGLEAQKTLESSWSSDSTEDSDTEEVDDETAFYNTYWELDTESFKSYLAANPALLADGYGQIEFEDLDEEQGIYTTNGDPVVALDVENNVLIVAIHGDDYQGKLAIIKDTSQVDLVKAKNFGVKGERVEEFAEDYDAILAINASHFVDVGGHGDGGTVKGSLVIDGVEYGYGYNSYWKFAGINQDGKMQIASYSSIDVTDYKWGVEAFPALIIDGEEVLDGSLGMGLQPRTAIGQTENGDFLMLIIDGRQVGWSLGCTVKDCSDILINYNCYQALNMDGGSSSVMWYKGQQITKSSSASGRGRYGPDALIVKKASLNLSNGSDCYNYLFQTSSTESDY